MGAIPSKLPGFQDVANDTQARARFGAAWGVGIPPQYGWHISEMLEAWSAGSCGRSM